MGGHRGKGVGAASIMALALAASAQGSDAGAYLVAAGGCTSCHTVDDGGDQDYMAGGRALETPFGVFYAPNITPDAETGIGGWSEEQFIRAFRHGEAPDGSHYYPAFPYTSYTGITDADLVEMKRYLDSIPAIRRQNREHQLVWFASGRWAMGAWKWMNFQPGAFEPDADRDAEWNRGAYLVRHLGHCGECHSARNASGAVRADRELAGNPDGPEGEKVPNITPHRDDGLGKWSASDLADLLEIGMYPDGDFVGGSMSPVIDHNTSRLTPEDRRAMIRYLQELPPLPAE